MSRVDLSSTPPVDPPARTSASSRIAGSEDSPAEVSFVSSRPSRDEYLLASIGLEEALARLGVADLVEKLEHRWKDSPMPSGPTEDPTRG